MKKNKTKTKKKYLAPDIIIYKLTLEQPFTIGSSTVVSGGSNTEPTVTDWTDEKQPFQNIDL